MFSNYSYQNCLLDLTAFSWVPSLTSSMPSQKGTSEYTTMEKTICPSRMNMFRVVQLTLTISVDCLWPIDTDMVDWAELIGSEGNTDLSGNHQVLRCGNLKVGLTTSFAHLWNYYMWTWELWDGHMPPCELRSKDRLQREREWNQSADEACNKKELLSS